MQRSSKLAVVSWYMSSGLLSQVYLVEVAVVGVRPAAKREPLMGKMFDGKKIVSGKILFRVYFTCKSNLCSSRPVL